MSEPSEAAARTALAVYYTDGGPCPLSEAGPWPPSEVSEMTAALAAAAGLATDEGARAALDAFIGPDWVDENGVVAAMTAAIEAANNEGGKP